MAGLGRKVFGSGDILLASEVQGFLQDQAVMVFDDDAARGSAIATPTEGMVTFRKDDNALEVFDGSVFAPIGSPPGLQHINSTTFTTSSSESFNDVFSATFDNYFIIFSGIGSTSTELNMRLRSAGTDNSTASSYVIQRIDVNGASVGGDRITATSFSQIGAISSTLLNATNIYLYDPFKASATATISSSLSSFSGGFQRNSVGTHNVTSSFDGFSFFPSSGTLTSGTIDIYGLRTT